MWVMTRRHPIPGLKGCEFFQVSRDASAAGPFHPLTVGALRDLRLLSVILSGSKKCG